MTHTRRYVVSIQLWLTIVSCRVTSSVRRNKRDPARVSERAGVTLMPAAFHIGDSKPLRADASLPFVQAMLRFS